MAMPIQRKLREEAPIAPTALPPAPPPTGGEPLPDDLRRDMERAFGHDLSDIRIHRSDAAIAIGARAFAQGNHLHFAPGEYDPSSQQGRKLIGHEIAHVIQQREGRVPSVVGSPIVDDPALERAADDAAARATRGEPAHPSRSRTSLAPEAARPELPRPPVFRDELRNPPRAQIAEMLADPALEASLPQIVPSLKVSDVLPSLQMEGLAALLIPHLSPAQCKLLGPELAPLLGPHLPRCWGQLAHLPLETVVLVAPETFAQLPASVLRTMPPDHQRYLAPFVKRVRNVDHADHELALCEALCQILHLYSHKVLDPEHIPSVTQLRALGELTAKAQHLRWLVDAAMNPAVKLVQVGSLKLTALIVELRRVGLRELANELSHYYQSQKQHRAFRYGADGIAYTADHVIGMRHQRVTEAGALAASLRDAVLRHASLRDNPDAITPGMPETEHDRHRLIGHPIPSARYLPMLSLDLDLALPRHQTQQALESVMHDQLGAPRLGVTIEEVRVRWSNGAFATYRRQHNAKYRPASSRLS